MLSRPYHAKNYAGIIDTSLSQTENIVSSCPTCATYQKRNSKAPLLPHSVLDHPWVKQESVPTFLRYKESNFLFQ